VGTSAAELLGVVVGGAAGDDGPDTLDERLVDGRVARVGVPVEEDPAVAESVAGRWVATGDVSRRPRWPTR
jgi:hypothetical protein